MFKAICPPGVILCISIVRLGIVRIPTVGELNFLVFKLLVNELLGVAQFRELNLLLLYDERRQLPLAPFLIPFSFVFDFVDLFIAE